VEAALRRRTGVGSTAEVGREWRLMERVAGWWGVGFALLVGAVVVVAAWLLPSCWRE
jgi:hypothetical protein